MKKYILSILFAGFSTVALISCTPSQVGTVAGGAAGAGIGYAVSGGSGLGAAIGGGAGALIGNEIGLDQEYGYGDYYGPGPYFF